MNAAKRTVGILVAVLMLGLVMAAGCGKKSSEEKLMERALEMGGGKDVDVKLRGEKVTVTSDGRKTELTETNEWPSGLTDEVPKFTAGRIKHVVQTHNQGESWQYNVHLADISMQDLRDYEKELKNKGWETQLMELGEAGGSVNAQKGAMGITMMFSGEEKSGVLGIHNNL